MIRRPSYEQLWSAFSARHVQFGPPREADDFGGDRHCRADVRRQLEQEARRYDLYAERLIAWGEGVPAPTALARCAQVWAGPAGDRIVSPGGALRDLARDARTLRARWRELWKFELERRRAERWAKNVRGVADELHRGGLAALWATDWPPRDLPGHGDGRNGRLTPWQASDAERDRALRQAAFELATAEGWTP